jgi:hypothetical protein
VKKYIALGVVLVVATELMALSLPDRRFVLTISGLAVGLAVLTLRWYLTHDAEPAAADHYRHDQGESLRHWVSRTESLIGWSESTRRDWDRHLRPVLARQFEMATSQRKAKDPAAFEATGLVLFGHELWGWIDPENVSRTGRDEPGPGRGVLDEILQRLEQV